MLSYTKRSDPNIFPQMKPIREIVVDCETTGLSRLDDRIIELGCVELKDLIPTGNYFHVYINPGKRKVHKEALRVHGITDAFLKDKPPFVEVALDFLEFVQGATLVAHNATFDIGMLNAEMKRLGLRPIQNQVVDTLPLAKEVKKGGLHNLDALCRHFDIRKRNRTKHGALLDAEILADVYVELRGGRQRGMDLSPEDVGGEQIVLQQYGERSIVNRITPEEMRSHHDFVITLGEGAIWNQYRTQGLRAL